MLTTSLFYQSYTTIIQTILQYHPMHKRNHNTLLINHQQWHHHKSPIFPMEPTATSYRLLWNCHNAIFFNYPRQPTSNSDVQGSRLATTWMNQRTTLHQHIPLKQGRSLASVVIRHGALSQTITNHQCRPLPDAKGRDTHIRDQQLFYLLQPTHRQCYTTTSHNWWSTVLSSSHSSS